MRRRDFLALPGMLCAPRVEMAGVVHRVTLRGAEPLMELGRMWRYGAARRVVVRAEGAWWAADVLPDRWEAWVDVVGGDAVHVVARGASREAPSHPVARAVRALLTAREGRGG
ncbi:MAG TPA: hypothetical protein VGK29_03540 [Paludibaculum sp.]|jgi:hypothetical protein